MRAAALIPTWSRSAVSIIEVDSERGHQLGLTSLKFGRGTYLWDEPSRVLVSFVHSLAPGNFRALVAAIHAEGKAVAVPTPLGRMGYIVRKNGYQHATEDSEMGSVEVWTLSPRQPEKEQS
jgi:hypothetical protein